MGGHPKTESAPPARIAYVILHQARPGIEDSLYEETVRALHERVLEESGRLSNEATQEIADRTTREWKRLLGSLAPYLETPFDRDSSEVGRILLEALRAVAPASATAGMRGALGHELKVPLTDDVAIQEDGGMSERGEQYLAAVGFGTTRPVLESVFHVLGGANLDSLEHIVRDRLGITSGTHGRHLAEFGSVAFAAYNCLLPGKAGGVAKGSMEAVAYCSKPHVPYDRFRTGLASLAGRYAQDWSAGSFSVWQRKLGLGAGAEFILRFGAEDISALRSLPAWLSDSTGAIADEQLVRETILRNGSLVLRRTVDAVGMVSTFAER